MPSPQRQREHGSPPKQGGGYPPAPMYGGPFPGGPPPPGFGGPQGFHPLPPNGQFGQFPPPYYGAFSGPHGNGYFPPHPSELSVRTRALNSPDRKSQHSSSPPSNKRDTPTSKRSTFEDIKAQEERFMKEKTELISMVMEEPPQSPEEELQEGEGEEQEEEEFTTGVNPMRSDFHFFASEHQEEELIKIKKSKEGDYDSPFLLMTSLNERLMKVWEDSSTKVRAVYMQKEESDRYRFMSEDEIASRHCATLTSRPSRKSHANAVANVVTKDEEDEEKNVLKRLSLQSEVSEGGEVSEYESPTKKLKEEEKETQVTTEENKEETESKDIKEQKETEEKNIKKEDTIEDSEGKEGTSTNRADEEK